jgi:hypothetical protein
MSAGLGWILQAPETQTTSLRGRVVYELAVYPVVSFIQDNFTVINPSWHH